MHLLIVEDDPRLGRLLKRMLEEDRHLVELANTGGEGLEIASTDGIEAVILDLGLPDMSGLEVARRLRDGRSTVPILILTARDAVEDRVAGLTAGGDDYVTKPFTLAEVVARVHAILRRTRGEAGGDTALRFADLVMEEDTREVWRGNDPLQLTATEFNLLRFFMRNPKRVLSKAQILDAVWHYDFGGNPNVVETYVSYLRKKLDRLGPPLIQTIRLVGYALREPEA
jgi:two-component system OmpR family response regulator